MEQPYRLSKLEAELYLWEGKDGWVLGDELVGGQHQNQSWLSALVLMAVLPSLSSKFAKPPKRTNLDGF
jgi:hypothetical protein